MRKFFFLLFILSAVSLSASRPLKMGIITDTHYLSEQLMDGGYAIQQHAYSTGREVIASPEILDRVIGDYLTSDIDVLLVCGDMVKDGEKQSHVDFVAKMKPLQDKGVRIFVVPGNHDIRFAKATRYQGNKTFETDGTTDQDFLTIYANCGYADPLQRDSNSLSYVASLTDSIWLLAIDAALYDPQKKQTPSRGEIKPETLKWITDILSQAQEEGKRVIGIMHWNITEHLPMQATAFPNHIITNHQQISTFLADNGVEAIFTGHFHSNDISAFTSEQGNTIYDIETGALVSFPFAYRFAELNGRELKIETRNVRSVPSRPNLAEESKNTLKRLSAQNGLPFLESIVSVFGKDDLEIFADIASDLYILHLSGDEIVPDSLKAKVHAVFEKNGFPVEESIGEMDIDFPPGDNNVTLTLKK